MLKYIGNGSFIPDIPARDLSDMEVDKFGGEEYLLSLGLYERVEIKSKKTKVENTEDGE